MKVLAIVPLPPPITGHSLLSSQLVDALRDVHDTVVIDLSIGSLNDGRVTGRRVAEVGRVLAAVWRHRRWADAIYFTISESRAGNLKDLFIYLLCLGRLRRMFVHLHGGTIGRELFDRRPLLRRLNAWFIGRLGGVIISGPAHLGIFEPMIAPDRIHVVFNSVEDSIFVTEADIIRKFSVLRPLRVLYLSAMTRDKGYLDLLEGWLRLDPPVRQLIQLDFAGRFEREDDRREFEARIGGLDGIHYHGLVSAEVKGRLLSDSHVFCLPTRMLEGQPISVLEAYAAGCVVVTTGQAGTRDVFADGSHGFEIDAANPASVAAALEHAVRHSDRLGSIGLANRRSAGDRYRRTAFTTGIRRLLETTAPASSR